MLKIEHLNKKYGNKEVYALENMNLTVSNKGFIAIIGSSGSGKTTLLNLLGGLDRVTEGSIEFDDINITDLSNKELEEYRNKYVSFIYQDFNLIDYLSVSDNASILVDCDEEILKSVGIYHLKDKSVNKLSGGEKQRVGIARALAKKPKIILADEPTGSLDSDNSRKVMDILKEISKNTLVIVVTHDESLALEYADKIITLKNSKIVNIKDNNELSDKEDFDTYKLNNLNKGIEKNIFKGMLFRNPLKFITSIILLTIILTTIIISNGISNINASSSLARSVTNEKDSVLYIDNIYGKKTNHKKYIGKKYFEKYNLINDNLENILSLYPNNEEYIKSLQNETSNSEEITDIRKYIVADTVFIIEDGIFKEDILGSLPKNENEIVITEALAKSYITYGIILSNNSNFNPQSMDDILDKEVLFGSIPVIIKGILKQDYDKYLNKKIDGISDSKYVEEIIKPGSFIYVTNEFEKYISKYTTYAIRDSEAKLNNNKLSNNTSFTFYVDNELKDNEIVLCNYYEKYLNKTVKLTINNNEYDMLVVGLDNENYISDKFIEKNDIKVANYEDSTNIIYFDNYDEVYNILKDVGTTFKLGANDTSKVYGLNTTFYRDVIFNNFSFVLKVGNILCYLSFLAIFIAVILMIIFCNQLVAKNKKDILILKGLGINNSSIIRIYSDCLFVYMSISLIFSILLSILCNFIINLLITNNFGFYFKPLAINNTIIVIISLVSIIVFFILLKLLSKKIKKTNPINLMKVV